MIDKIREYIKEYHMLAEGDTVVAGVSGGADSVCLLLVLQRLRKEIPFAIRVVHIEHGIRGEESLRDAAFVKALCDEQELPFVQYSFDVPKIAKERGVSVEEAGRLLRYEAFEKEAEKYPQGKIAVAHHRNDSAETMLHHLIRGSQVAGLAGIAPVRDNVIRPLLCVDREEIENYLQENGQDYCVDVTNEETIYTRNRIRHEVMPILQEINPSAVAHMAKTGEVLREVQEYLSVQAQTLSERVVTAQREGQFIDVEQLKAMPQLLRNEIMYQVLAGLAGSKKDITNQHVYNLWELSKKQVGREIHLPYQLIAKREYDGIWIGKLPEEKQLASNQEILLWECNEFSCRILENTEQIQEIPKKTYTKWLDYDRIKGNLCVRNRRQGDFFWLDADGHTKKLKQFFVDEKIPKERRDEILLVAEGSHILWIVGYRISAYYKITEHTKRVLEVQYEKLSANGIQTGAGKDGGRASNE